MTTLALRLLGMGMFLGTLAIVAGSIVAISVALGLRRPALLRWTAAVAGAWLACYALVLALGPVMTAPRALAVGDELSFCGFDCHLHVSVAGARADSNLTITLRLRSDAKRAAEYPSHLRVRVVDAAGREYAPVHGSLRDTLAAGMTATEDLRFTLPRGSRAAALAVTWGDWQDYLVPGPENRLMQRRRTLLLPAVEVSRASGRCGGC